MIPRLILLATILLYGTLLRQVDAATATQDSSASASKTLSLPRRDRNLDFLDAATLAYYLGLDPTTGQRLSEPPTPSTDGHNVAVMFYAQWDRNSHALAPTWDRIGTILKAGTRKANLIMGLFDCEMDQVHLTLCHAAGVTHYPTLMFISPSRRFPHKPHVQKSKKALSHTTQFPGMWQYDKSVMDWLKTMQGLSGWSSFWNKKSGPKGWWQAASHDPATAELLPVGIPATGGGAGSAAEVQQQATALKEVQAENQQYQELTLRSALMLDAMLFPVANPNDKNANTSDVYTELYPLGWNATSVKSKVLRTCAMEIALDYCVRLSTHKTEELVAAKTAAGTTGQTLAELEAELKEMIVTAEPYCDIVEDCVVKEFASEACTPPTCPFQQEAACRYLTSCFDESMQSDYAKALGVELPKPGAPEESPKKKRGWF